MARRVKLEVELKRGIRQNRINNHVWRKKGKPAPKSVENPVIVRNSSCVNCSASKVKVTNIKGVILQHDRPDKECPRNAS